MQKSVIFSGLLSVLVWTGQAGAQAPQSGVTGTVSQTPGCPGPQHIDQGPCVAPVAAVQVQLRSASGKVIGSAPSDPDGRFVIHAPAGKYRLHAKVEGAFPRCEDAKVTVRTGRLTHADVRCDSGMR
jgi:hypothetical protein